jgi:hypothetical protein
MQDIVGCGPSCGSRERGDRGHRGTGLTRRPSQMSFLRKQEPIATGGCDQQESRRAFCHKKGLSIWVPAFAGTTRQKAGNGALSSRHGSVFPRHQMPGLGQSLPRFGGRRECRVLQRTHGLACKIKKHTSKFTTGTSHRPTFPARWCYGLLHALPGDRAFLSPSSAQRVSIVANLTPASRRQNHVASSYASGALVSCADSVHRIPHPTS